MSDGLFKNFLGDNSEVLFFILVFLLLFFNGRGYDGCDIK